MQIQVNFGDVDASQALNDHTESAVLKELEHVAVQVTRVEVHIRDDKSNRHGADDKRCLMEARIAGEQPLAVDAKGDDLYKAITDAAGKLGRAVNRKLDRHQRI
ncbi:MAG: HPF/RaiA family ribosome-associated protein [Planctomycetota bacterium]